MLRIDELFIAYILFLENNKTVISYGLNHMK